MTSSATKIVRFNGSQAVIDEDFQRTVNAMEVFKDSIYPNLCEFEEKSSHLLVLQTNQEFLANATQPKDDDATQQLDLSNENQYKKSKSKRKLKKKEKKPIIFMNNMFNGNIHF